jgi:hypothetical protein
LCAGFSPGGLCLSGIGELAVMLEQIAIEHGLRLFKSLALASLSSLTKRSWNVPHNRSILPLACGEPAKIRVTPSSSKALPTSVSGRLLMSCSSTVGSRSVQKTECRSL